MIPQFRKQQDRLDLAKEKVEESKTRQRRAVAVLARARKVSARVNLRREQNHFGESLRLAFEAERR